MKSEFGLIGRKLSHSFSKRFFEEKFRILDLQDHHYHLFEIESASELRSIIKNNPELCGLNVTIPYKEDVLDLLDDIDEKAARIGSVNVIKIDKNGILKGFNTDYFGFLESLKNWIPSKDLLEMSALVFGTGGASKAICRVLEDLEIDLRLVSRNNREGVLSYSDLQEIPDYIRTSRLLINTTPLGMHPQTETYPDLDYRLISQDHFVFDLVYNPEQTVFLSKSHDRGAKTKNGIEMLQLQAEKSWEIWTE